MLTFISTAIGTGFVVSFVQGMDAKVLFDKVSRCDFYTDLPGQAVDPFVDALDEGRMITQAKANCEYGKYNTGRRKTGMSVGKNLMFRAYDKVNELKRDNIKREAWTHIQWNGTAPKQCTRIEFELKRETLKTFEIEGLDSLIEKRASIVEYLTTKWIRFCDEPVNQRNPQRTKTAELWNTVHAAFTTWAGQAIAAVKRIFRKNICVDDLRKQVRGCLESMAAVIGVGIESLDDFAGFAMDQLYKLKDEGFAERVLGKRLHLESIKTMREEAYSSCSPSSVRPLVLAS